MNVHPYISGTWDDAAVKQYPYRQENYVMQALNPASDSRSDWMNLPPAVQAYFEAEKIDDADVLARAFSTGAVVEDEGARHEGVHAIQAWWSAAKKKYHHIAEAKEMIDAGDKVCVRADVTGNFPNSPTTLVFVFTIANGEIARLRIL